MDADLDTLATALYVKTDDLLKDSPAAGAVAAAMWASRPSLSDAELVTLAVMQALLGFTSGGPLAAARPRASAGPVPVPAGPVRL